MTDRYVDPLSGNDANTGSLASPWKTFGKVKTSATTGDKIIIIGSATEASPKDMPMGSAGSVFLGAAANNFFIENLPDTHLRLSSLGRGIASSGFTWERWTAGGIQVRGSGSIRIGPMDPNQPVGNSQYFFGAIQLTGCSGMLFDGGVNKKLFLNSGGGDIGAYMTVYGSSPTGVGTTNVTWQNFDASGNALGIYIRGGATNTQPAIGGQGVIFQDFISHDNNLYLEKATASETGAMGVALSWCQGVIVRRFAVYRNYTPYDASSTYGTDGGGVETFGAYDLVIEDGEFYDNDGGIETGRNATSPYSTGNIFRRLYFHGSSNPGGKPTTTQPTILLRDFQDGQLYHCTFDVTDCYQLVSLYPDQGGTYAGSILRARVTNNNFVLRQNSSRAVVRVGPNLPTGVDAIVLDYNNYWRPVGGTVIGEDANQTGFRTWAQWQALGYESHGKNQDPLIDATGFPGAGSPVIDSGVIISGQTYVGSAPDMGKFETAVVPPPPPPPPSSNTGLSDYLANKLLDQQYGGVAWTPPGTQYIQLHTADPGPLGSMTAGILPRVAIANTLTNWPTATSRSKANALKIGFGSTAGNNSYGFARYASAWDASSGGNMLEWWLLATPVDLNDRQEVAINPGQLVTTRLT